MKKKKKAKAEDIPYKEYGFSLKVKVDSDSYDEILKGISRYSPFFGVGDLEPSTPAENFANCMRCNTEALMTEWFEETVSKLAITLGTSTDRAEERLRLDLGYMAGLDPQGPDKLEYLYTWLGIEHPTIGTPDDLRVATQAQMDRAAKGWEWELAKRKQQIS